MKVTGLSPLLDVALANRKAQWVSLATEGTDCYRLFHGVAEGCPGLTVDRYGPLVLAHTFREPLLKDEQDDLEAYFRGALGFPFEWVYNHRGKKVNESFDQWHLPVASALGEFNCHEMGVKFLIRARHQGIDPWLFLDLRAGRRYLRDRVRGSSVLNLFAYTCSAGVSAMAAGASEVWNVDFASSSLAIGSRNAELNQLVGDRFRTIQQDCLPVIRQLAGLPSAGRFGKSRASIKMEPRNFDWVFLDPPTWAKSMFGAVDIESDYPSLFKPAVLIARPGGGRVIATNHLPAVELEPWKEILQRCAAKAGRPLRSIEIVAPENDFPSFDGRHPLKIAVCEV